MLCACAVSTFAAHRYLAGLAHTAASNRPVSLTVISQPSSVADVLGTGLSLARMGLALLARLQASATSWRNFFNTRCACCCTSGLVC